MDRKRKFKQITLGQTCGGCGHLTNVFGARICKHCTTHQIDQCFDCHLKLTSKTRTWVVQTQHPGYWYVDLDYERACRNDGIEPILQENRNIYGCNNDTVVQGPIPRVEFAYYAMARWQNPWRPDVRQRGGDCTLWKPTGYIIQNCKEEMRRIPYCLLCAWKLPREYQNAPFKKWNRWRTETNSGSYTDITSPEQLQCC